MPEWLKALRRLCDAGQSSILVSVIDAQGSTPRAAGARLVVTADSQDDTIGGGHLEWRAMEIAQEMLAAPGNESAPALQRFPLGPSLGQCCGGAVQLLFERIHADESADAMITALSVAWEQGCDVWRMLPLEAGGKALVAPGRRVLEVQPTEIHQRTPIVLGSADEVDLVMQQL